MAPAKKRAAPPPQAQPAPVVSGRDVETNRSIFEAFGNDLTTIAGHAVFKNIVDEKPIRIVGGGKTSKEGGGNQVAYTPELYETAMKSKAASYKCGGNIFWLDHSFNPSSGTPLSMQRIKDFKEFSFSKPSPYPTDVIVAVPHDQFNPMEHLGALKSVTPIEVLIAFAQAVAEAVKSEKPEAILKEWRHQALTCAIVFEVLASND